MGDEGCSRAGNVLVCVFETRGYRFIEFLILQTFVRSESDFWRRGERLGGAAGGG